MAYMHTNMHACIHTCINACIYTPTYMQMHIYMHTSCMHPYMHACTYIHQLTLISQGFQQIVMGLSTLYTHVSNLPCSITSSNGRLPCASKIFCNFKFKDVLLFLSKLFILVVINILIKTQKRKKHRTDEQILEHIGLSKIELDELCQELICLLQYVEFDYYIYTNYSQKNRTTIHTHKYIYNMQNTYSKTQKTSDDTRESLGIGRLVVCFFVDAGVLS